MPDYLNVARLLLLLLLGLPLLARHPLATRQADRGRVPAMRLMSRVTAILQKTPKQQAELERLLEAQQDPAAAEYHRWLTPEQFADRFGVSAAESDRLVRWLTSRGLKVEQVARSRSWIAFSGAAIAVEAALNTELHYYEVDGRTHYAAASNPTVPAELHHLVAGFTGLNDFNRRRREPAMLNFTDGTHGLAPDDFATIYNITPLYAAGIDGAGQTIVVAGQSRVNVSDVTFFRNRFGLTRNDPEVQLVGQDPGFDSGDGVEAVLDIAWAGAIARRAHIIYVYAGDVIDAATFAIDQNLAPVISYSFGICEALQIDDEPLFRRAIAQQANAQGITWVASSGDTGAAGCDLASLNPFATKGLAVTLPSSMPEVTAVGGTQFNEGTGAYWATSNSATLASALGYIPEVAWNDSARRSFPVGSGGGSSIFYPKPAWQAGPGVPATNARHVPDIAFTASSTHDPYVIFVSGSTTAIGGTSASAPAFAGVVALLNQYAVSKGLLGSPGVGNVNPALYRMAQSVPAAFHDVTSGDNRVPCAIGTTDCDTGQVGYAAGAGYDRVTGLGSLDVFRFVSNWNPVGAQSTTDVRADRTAAVLTDMIEVTVSVRPATAKGSVSLTFASLLLGTVELTGGVATFRVPAGILPLGDGALVASYTGDAALNGSAGAVTLTISRPSGHSAVALTVPNPVYQGGDFTVTLKEVAGVATTVTQVAVDGVALGGSSFSRSIPANGTVTATLPIPATQGQHVVTFAGQDAGGFQWTQDVTVQVFGTPYFTYIGGIANAASGQVAFAPGAIMSVYGDGLADAVAVANSLPLPVRLGRTSATVNGRAAPLYFVSGNQVNLQIPYETPTGTAVLEVANGANRYSYSFPVVENAPGIFTDERNRPVPFPTGARGGTYVMFITGDGALSPALATGASPAPGTPVNQLPAPVKNVAVSIGGAAAVVQFAGVPPGVAGVTQINFTVPQNAPLGAQALVVTIGTTRSLSARFTVTQ